MRKLISLIKKNIIMKLSALERTPLLKFLFSSILLLIKHNEKDEIKVTVNTYAADSVKSDKKKCRKLYRDIIFSYYAYGIAMPEYFLFDFQNLSRTGRLSFLGDNSYLKYLATINNINDCHYFDNKDEAYKLFGKYYARDLCKIDSENDFPKFEEFVNKHPIFFVKPISLSMGRGVGVYNINDYSSIKDAFNSIFKTGSFIIEEKIIQSDEMAGLHPFSVNTVRMNTFLQNDDVSVHIHRPFLRIGRNHSIVDNAGAGGMIAQIDVDTGIVFTKSIDKLGNYYIVHPDTKQKIVGFEIPRWNEAISLAKELANILPSVRYVGWDLALTPNGWIVIEGNSHPQFLVQYTDKVGRLGELTQMVQSVSK